LSEAAVSYAFEQLEPSDPPPRDAPARMIAQATAEAERIREHARAEGYAEGRDAGRDAGVAEISAATAALGEALQGIASLRAEVVEAVEHDAIELALALSEKILAGALQARPELVIEVVQGALRRIGDRRRITVLVNPADLEAVTAAIAARTSENGQQSQAAGVELCDVQSDQRVGAGGAIVRTAEGEVDASVQTQLERAREVVLAELETGERSSESGQPA
jgi:flagellar assembly protein FliH